MTGQPRTLRALRGLSAALRDAVAESKLAYELNANTYSYSCLSACLSAERALEMLRDALEARDGTQVSRTSPWQDERRKDHIEASNEERRKDNEKCDRR
jgi:hypothetical protein